MSGFFARIRNGLRNFMEGRYGHDKLNMTILVLGVVLCVLAMFTPWAAV